ncbi:DUF3761 domain-containing protein [Streptomyces sp. BF23-18]|uniref:DUF3761 domain-containing protein n=1 Tax=Streptomyces sp. BF23-18 TaxID=3240282 RepID=UPI0034E3A151
MHRPEQNTASAAIVCGSGSPHSRQYRRAVLSAPTTQIIQPYTPHGQGSKTPTQPRGATAKCKDGSYSYSASFRGTCSHQRGVKYCYQ